MFVNLVLAGQCCEDQPALHCCFEFLVHEITIPVLYSKITVAHNNQYSRRSSNNHANTHIASIVNNINDNAASMDAVPTDDASVPLNASSKPSITIQGTQRVTVDAGSCDHDNTMDALQVISHRVMGQLNSHPHQYTFTPPHTAG